MPRRTRTSGRYPPRRSSSVGDDDDDDRRQVNPAAVVAIVAVVIGAGLLIWVMSGGPTRRPAATPLPQPDPVVIQPLPNGAVSNRSPRAEIRLRIDPRLPSQMEYSGAFSTDPDLQDEDRLSYTWDFGDGTQGVSSDRGVYGYRQSGTFIVRLVVRDPAGAESTATQTVEITPVEDKFTGSPRSDQQPGLDARWLPLERSDRFATIDPRWGEGTTFTVTQVDLDRRPKQEWYALRFSGFIEMPEAGLWTFSLTSDDGSRLILDGKAIMTMDEHQGATTKNKTVEVTDIGLVPFRLDYYQGNSDQVLRLEWTGPSTPQQPIPASAFVRPAD